LALIIFVVSEKKAFEHFPIGSNVNLCIAPGMIIGWSSTKYMFLMSIGNPRWPPPQYTCNWNIVESSINHQSMLFVLDCCGHLDWTRKTGIFRIILYTNICRVRVMVFNATFKNISAYNLILNSGKKIRTLHDKKNKYSNSCVVWKKNSERNKKP
jgi:hypothetical protein